MLVFKILSLATLLMLILQCKCAKILYVMPFTAKSHYISQKELALELARRGHEVFVITAHRELNPPPTYHEVMVSNKTVWETLFPVKPNVFTMADLSFAQFQDLMYQAGYFVNDIFFNSSDVQNFLEQDHEFDLVINELFYQESLYMLAHKYNAPQILVTTFGNSLKANYFGRNPLQLSSIYHEYGVTSDPFSFVGRLKNLYYCLYDLYKHKFVYLPKQEEFARQNFKDLPEPIPRLEELIENAALVLMNNHFSIDVPAAYLPNFIEVGGLNHISNNTLPKDLQKILDEAKDGVVYLNFGSNVASSDLSPDKFKAFMTVFKELKQTVLMKWEDNNQKDVPKNVILRKWFPQKEILEHPNIKVFICHGGLIGFMEAVASGVPVIGVPVFGDQYLNLFHAVQRGFGEIITYDDISETKLRHVLHKILKNDVYKQNAQLVSKRFHDRPMTGLNTAIWWIEYVIRHKGAEFIKPPTLKMSFIAYYMLDVFVFLLLAILAAVYFSLKIFKCVNLKIFKNQDKPKRKQKKK